MIQTFTREDIIRYAYQETTDEENELIEHGLIAEPGLQYFLEEISELQADLDRLLRTPSERSIQNILRYSQTYTTEQA